MCEENIKFDEKGLIPAIVQDSKTLEVLMLGYMNKEAYEKTLKTKKVHFYSRSRNKLWLKGESSKNYLYLESLNLDCDNDTVLVKVNPAGPTCHTGEVSCFFKKIIESEKNIDQGILFKLYNLIEDRKENPIEGSYTNYLLEKGIDKILKKVGEEAAETIIACKNEDREEIVYETSDLLYHLIVMLSERGVLLEEIFIKLNERYK